jgi:hypothetical protein
MRQAYCIEIPRRMGKPLFGPSPVFILAGDRKALVERDASSSSRAEVIPFSTAPGALVFAEVVCVPAFEQVVARQQGPNDQRSLLRIKIVDPEKARSGMQRSMLKGLIYFLG